MSMIRRYTVSNPEVTFYLDPAIHEKVISDMKLFQITTTESDFIKRIIVNYFPIYQKQMYDLSKLIEKSFTKQMNQELLNTEACGNIAWDVMKYLDERNAGTPSKKKKKDKIHFRINRYEHDLDMIVCFCPSGTTKSEFIAYIICSYLSIPENVRNEIVFKKEIENEKKYREWRNG